jgi:hypothetical protein
MLKRYQTFIAGMLFATGSWIIVIGLRERLLEKFAATNQYIIGLALIGFAWLIGGKL